MSKYTTEVRFICEEAAGLDSSVGYNDVNEVVTKAYPKIFDNSLVFHNEETKSRLLPKILLHYYQREIGFETVGLWKLKLNQKMREILPYYNQLYASEEIEYNPLQNVDNYHTHEGEYSKEKNNENSSIDDHAETRNLTTTDDHTETRNLNKTDDHTETRNLTKTDDHTETRNLTTTDDHTETRNLTTTDDHTETRNLSTVDNGSNSYDRNEDTILRHDKTITRGNDVRTRGNDTTAQADDVTIRANDTNTHVVDSALDHWEMFSDTPQGGIDGVQLAGGVGTSGTLSDNAYLTNATHITESPAQTHDTTQHGNVTQQHGTITNTYGNETQQFGDVVETYNKLADKADHVDADGWEKIDNENTHTGTVRNAGENTDTGTVRNAGENTNTGTVRNAGENVDTGTVRNAGENTDTGTIRNAGEVVQTGTIRKAGSNTSEGNQKDDGTDSYTKHEYGKIGVQTYQEMIMKWRNAFLNIDMMIISELDDLFMKVW